MNRNVAGIFVYFTISLAGVALLREKAFRECITTATATAASS
jgi:hypothetical protein